MTDLIKRLRTFYELPNSAPCPDPRPILGEAADALERIGWNTDMDAAPKDGTVIIAMHTDRSGVFLTRFGTYESDANKDGWFEEDYSDEALDFYQWMHLPPKGDE